MARETIAGEKKAWERDIEDLEHQKIHLEKELDGLLRSEDINVATDEDAHEEVRVKIRAVEEKIKSIRENHANDDAGPIVESDNDNSSEIEEEREPPEFLTVNFDEAKAEWREWKRALPKDPFAFTKGFKRQLGGNGTLAHSAEAAAESAIAAAMSAYEKMQATRRWCTEDNLDKAEKTLAECQQFYEDTCNRVTQIKQLAKDLGVPDIDLLMRGKEDLVYPPNDKLEYDHEQFLREEAARKQLAAAEAAEKALKESASKFANLLTSSIEAEATSGPNSPSNTS